MSNEKSNTAIFTQTDTKVHEQWAKLCLKKPRAAAIMHQLVSMMRRGSDRIVISQSNLAKIMGIDRRTVIRAIKDLEDSNYLQIVKIASNSNAYVINRRVSWTKKRDQTQITSFDAIVIVNREDQSAKTLEESNKLNALPMVTPPDIALPHGEGDSGEQMDLPTLSHVIETAPDDYENE